MRIVFMGTPGFAVPALSRLINSHHEVVAVVCQPDKPVGRGKRIQMPAVKEKALEHSIPVLQPPKMRNTGFDEVIRSYQPDVIVVVAYGKILAPDILAIPKYGCLNIHASLLPKYRGAAPIQWAIINGESQTGVTIMQLDEGMDTGNIIAFETVDILDDDDMTSVSNMLSVLGGELMLKVLEQIEKTGVIDSIPQNEAQATHAPMLEKKHGLIDWNLTNEEIVYRIKGLQPWPTAFSFLHGRAWKFLKAEPFKDPDGLFFREPHGPEAKYTSPIEPGKVTAIVRGVGFTVKTGDGHLMVTSVQPADKKPMTAVDAINGKLVKKGDEFLSDPNFLEGNVEVV